MKLTELAMESPGYCRDQDCGISIKDTENMELNWPKTDASLFQISGKDELTKAVESQMNQELQILRMEITMDFVFITLSLNLALVSFSLLCPCSSLLE